MNGQYSGFVSKVRAIRLAIISSFLLQFQKRLISMLGWLAIVTGVLQSGLAASDTVSWGDYSSNK